MTLRVIALLVCVVAVGYGVPGMLLAGAGG